MVGSGAKYKTRFPTSRIKKIMQADEEIGKVALSAPIIVSRAVELFLQSLVEGSLELVYKNDRSRQTPIKLSPGVLKKLVQTRPLFDFLRQVFKSVADEEILENSDKTKFIIEEFGDQALEVQEKRASETPSSTSLMKSKRRKTIPGAFEESDLSTAKIFNSEDSSIMLDYEGEAPENMACRLESIISREPEIEEVDESIINKTVNSITEQEDCILNVDTIDDTDRKTMRISTILCSSKNPSTENIESR